MPTFIGGVLRGDHNRFIVYGRLIRAQAREGADGAKVAGEALKSR
ncbi:hypothetical protein [Aminobacter niigataensis]|nr:hypothetical protein [Aminobacter niigataensis]